MKLGLLGVCRLCFWLLPTHLFNVYYSLFSLSLAVVFFVVASGELDGKRWLAFMSLGHMCLIPLCVCSVDYSGFGLSFLYSLGHGVSASVVFFILWVWYEWFGTRNWFLLKSGFSAGYI